jgi:hypothetical protein
MSEAKKPGPSPPTLTLSPDLALGQYANFVGITHSFPEVLLDFGRTLPNRSDIPIVARIIMSPFQAKQMLRALAHNLQIYERTFGPIPDLPPAPPPAPPRDTN